MGKYRNYYVDWWRIKKSSVYTLIAVLVFLGALAGGAWWLMKNNWFLTDTAQANVPKDAARIISFEGDVRLIRASTRETEKVTKDAFLSAGDTIQTQADGKSQIRMIDGSVLTIRPNSTVVIRDSASIFGGTNVRVALDNGQINVKTEDQPEASNNIVEVKQVENRIQGQTEASFNSSGNGGEIRISRGGVESTVAGEKTVIKDSEYVAINQNGKLSPKEKLYEPPKLIVPASLEQFLASSGGFSDVTFRWQKSDPTTDFSYRLEVASSPFFVPDAMVIQRESLTAPSFTLGNIVPGVYYWRVRGISTSGQTTEWSEPWRFTVVKREGNEKISATDWQVENIGGKLYLISGKTVSGAIVRIIGRETFAGPDGSFKMQVSVPTADATVEIRDEHGNRTTYVISLQTAKVVRQF
jgi:hypothetical protein